MTDLLVVGLLLLIIFILVAVYAPEIIIYGGIALCVTVLIICVAVLGVQFIHDPIGFLYSGLVTNNPVVSFENSIISAIPTPTEIKPSGPVTIFVVIWEIAALMISIYIVYEIFISPYRSRRDSEENK